MPTNLKTLFGRSRSRSELKQISSNTPVVPGSETGEKNVVSAGLSVVASTGTGEVKICDEIDEISGPSGATSCHCNCDDYNYDLNGICSGNLPSGCERSADPRLFPGHTKCEESLAQFPASAPTINSTTTTTAHHNTDQTCCLCQNININNLPNSSQTCQQQIQGEISPPQLHQDHITRPEKILSNSNNNLQQQQQNSNSKFQFFQSWRFPINNSLIQSSSKILVPEFPTTSAYYGGSAGGNGVFSSKSQLSIPGEFHEGPLTPLNRLRKNNFTSVDIKYSSAGSRSSSLSSFIWDQNGKQNQQHEIELLCRLCLTPVRYEDTYELQSCTCRYCKECLVSYINFEIQEGSYDIACPDSQCEKQGVLNLMEIESFVTPTMMDRYRKFRLYTEVEKDRSLMWCPSIGCETVCRIIQVSHSSGNILHKKSKSRLIINCPTCCKSHCAECKLPVHQESCESWRKKLIKQGILSADQDPEELFNNVDSKIKKCPFCHVPIEKDSGCAQMMCKKCKHVFCWYCLASLDDDFLLRHYDKGPCKNKLGHSRASVVWHRAQVIGIFAGFGLLVLLASPILILAAPCLLCCRCRYCASKLDPDESPVQV